MTKAGGARRSTGFGPVSGEILSATIIDGKAFAARLRARVAEEVARIKMHGITPGLAVVQVG